MGMNPAEIQYFIDCCIAGIKKPPIKTSQKAALRLVFIHSLWTLCRRIVAIFLVIYQFHKNTFQIIFFYRQMVHVDAVLYKLAVEFGDLHRR